MEVGTKSLKPVGKVNKYECMSEISARM